MTPKFDWNVDMDGKGNFKTRKKVEEKIFGRVRFVRFQALSPVNPIDFIKSVWQKLKMQLILLFSLFLLLFMDPTVLFGTIHDSHCTFQLIFTFIYSIFNKKFSVSAK